MRVLRFFGCLLVMLLTVAGVRAQDDNMVRLRFAHFSPDAPAVDIYVNGEVVAETATYTTISDWRGFGEEAFEVAVTLAGEPLDEAILGPVEYTFERNTWHIVMVIGLVEQDSLQVHTVQEDHTSIASGEVRVTVVNTISDNLPVTFAAGNTQLVSGLSYPGASGDNDGAVTTDIIAQTYDLRLVDTVNASRVFFELDDVALGRGRQYLVVALGYRVRPTGLFVSSEPSDVATGEAAEAPAEDDASTEGGQTRLRLANFATDTPPLDLYLNEELMDLQAVQRPNLSDWISQPAQSYEVALVPMGDPYENSLVAFEATLNADVWNTILLVGQQADDSLIGRVIEEDYTDLATGQSRITVLNAVPNSPPLSVRVNDQPPFSALTFAGAAPDDGSGMGTVTLSAAGYDISVLDARVNEPYVEPLNGVQLVAGNHYYIGIVSDDTSQAQLYLQAVTQQAVKARLED